MHTYGRSCEVIVGAVDTEGHRGLYKVCTTRDYFLDREAGVEDEGMERSAGGRDFGRRLDLREFCGLCLLAVVFGCIHARAGPYRSSAVHTREVDAAEVTRAYQGSSATGM